MGMPGRKFSEGGGAYRYGFNGKEKDGDIISLTAYDYGFRIYNPALGRFLSVDPLARSYPWYTPYQFAGNKPIIAIDLDGAEELWSFGDIIKVVTFIAENTTHVQEYYLPINGTLNNEKVIIHHAEKQSIYIMTNRWLVNPNNSDHVIRIPENKNLVDAAYLVYNKFSETYEDGYTSVSLPSSATNWDDLEKAKANTNSPEDIQFQQFADNVKTAIDLIALGVTTYQEFPTMGGSSGTGRMYSRHLGKQLLSTLPQTTRIVATGISGLKFNFSQLTKILTPAENDMMVIYRGITGSEKGGGALFFTDDAAYAATYSSTVKPFRISRSGYNRLVNEGLIEELIGVHKNSAPTKEIKVSNKEIQNLISTFAQ